MARTEVAKLTLNKGENGISAAAIDVNGGYGYFGTSQIHWYESASLVKVSLSNFSIVSRLVLGTNESLVRTIVIDPLHGFAYLGVWNGGLGSYGPTASISRIVKVRLSDLNRIATCSALPAGGYIESAIMDAKHGFGYFAISSLGPWAGYPPAEVVRIRLSDFSVNATLSIGLRDDEIPFGIIDDTNGFAYFYDISWAYPNAFDRLVKIRLSDFKEVGSVNNTRLGLGKIEWLASGVIDLAGTYGYFGTGASTGVEGEGYGGGSIIKVRLSDLTPMSRVVQSGDALRTAVLDPIGGFAYFGWDYGNPGTVDVVRLSDFTFNGTLSLSERSLNVATIDPVHGYAYFAGGTYDEPGYILKIKLIPPSPSSTTTTTVNQITNSSLTSESNTTSTQAVGYASTTYSSLSTAVTPHISGSQIEAILLGFAVAIICIGVSRRRGRSKN
jgi:hypothetical protein